MVAPLKVRAALRVGAAALLALLALPGCRPAAPRGRAVDWPARWPALARAGPRWRAGTEFVIVTRKGRPGGPEVTRDHWLLLRRDSLQGDFEIQRAAGAPIVRKVPMHPAVPRVPVLGPGRGHDVYPYGGGFVAVTVPAGRFRCARTWRTYEASDGAVMRVDEWWAPGVPMPVQRWTRWEGVADTLVAPPRRPADLRVGTEWAVLERIRQQ